MSFRLVLKSVTLNDLERRNGPFLRYFTEFGSFRAALPKSDWRCRRRKFTFAISSSDEFLVTILAIPICRRRLRDMFTFVCRRREPVANRLTNFCYAATRDVLNTMHSLLFH